MRLDGVDGDEQVLGDLAVAAAAAAVIVPAMNAGPDPGPYPGTLKPAVNTVVPGR